MTEYFTPQTVLPEYMQFPKFLFDQTGLGDTAKLIYMVLLDRTRLSAGNEGWTDREGRVYVVFPIEHLGEAVGKKKSVVKQALAELEKRQLLRREHQGLGKANRIFLRIPEAGKPAVSGSEKRPSESRKSGRSAAGKPATNKNNYSKNNYSKNDRNSYLSKPLCEISYECSEEDSL